MRKNPSIILAGLLLVLIGVSAFGQEEAEKSYTVWFGGHYTGFSDNHKKVGEYRIANSEEFLPEMMIDYRSLGDGNAFSFNGRYYDYRNVFGSLKTRTGDVFSGKFSYNSLVHQEGQDDLENFETREAGGGKILTHEVFDPGAHYYTHRQEIEGEIKGLISRRHNIKMMVAHRSVIQKGTEQSVSNNHCFSCHVSSHSAAVDKITHQLQASVQGDIARNTLGYDFAYRIFESKADPAYGYYDPAVHPVNGGSGAEFSSREIYDDTTLPVNAYPNTEKFQHKVRLKGDLGKGKYASALSYSRAKNKGTELVTTAWAGNLFYSYPLGKKIRLIARATGTRLRTDDVYIDLPLFRGNTSFDYIRYSSLDRADARGSLELISRLSPRWTGSLAFGFNHIDRYDYPEVGDGTKTTRFIGQLKLRYRKGMEYSSNVKYRLEVTSDPFVSGRGLFEARADTILAPVANGGPFVFYWQREALRYQDITTEPTQAHIFEWTSNWRPSNILSVNVGLKGKYDKNGDLDSLDISHLQLQPHLSLNYAFNPEWSFMAGGSYTHYKSRGPVAVALFDG